MANPEHLAKLKTGIKAWNAWRTIRWQEEPDLSGVDFASADLKGATLHRTNFSGSDLSGADLTEVHLKEANLNRATLAGSNLCRATLEGAILGFSNLNGADLSGADLTRASLIDANLTGTDVRRADLRWANLSGARFSNANLSKASVRGASILNTVLADLDLSKTEGLDTFVHLGPSIVDHRTLMKSGTLPPKFLRGCGLSDWQIEDAKLLNPDLTPNQISEIQYRVFELRSARPIQVSPLFISYSHDNAGFVDTLEPLLENAGILFWRDVHSMTSGRMDRVVERAMRQNPTLLLILSEASVESDWVQFEVRQGTKLSKELKRDVLCPIALDDAWKDCDWPGPLRQQVEDFSILDFSDWRDPEKLDQQFRKLIRGLELFYRPKNEPADG